MVRRLALITLATLWALVVGAAVGGQPIKWDVFLLAFLTAIVLIVVDQWYRSDRFVQWFRDPPHIDIEIAQPDDQFGEMWLQGLHLTAKNRPQKARKTRAARDAWLHAIVDGGSMGGGRFDTELVWSVFGPPTKITDLVSGDRVYVPLAMKAHGTPKPPFVSHHAERAAA